MASPMAMSNRTKPTPADDVDLRLGENIPVRYPMQTLRRISAAVARRAAGTKRTQVIRELVERGLDAEEKERGHK
jgi:hypothetical protein